MTVLVALAITAILARMMFGVSPQPMTKVPVQTETFQVLAVTSPAEREQFLDVPAAVYANDPNWVAPLRSSIAKQIAPDNPFLEYGSFQPFIAVQSGPQGTQLLGRIVAAVNRRLIEREGKNVGLFGFFECVNQFEVAQGLFQAAADWLRREGMAIARGPIDLSTHNNCLFLVDGFDSPPMVMMPYHPSYYRDFMERDGWHKAKDAYAYNLPLDRNLPPEFEKGYRIAVKSGVQFRQLNLKGDAFRQDCISLYHLFTAAFANNYSSTPRTQEEFLEEANDLQSLVDPNIFWLAEYEGKMVGFFMALPDYNVALKRVNGKLDWVGILKFLWFRRQINSVRVIAICALPEYKRKLIPLALIHLAMQQRGKTKRPYERAELSWVYEDNMPSRHVIEGTGATIYKTYRIYEKDL